MLENYALKFNFQVNYSGNVPFVVNVPFKSNQFLADCIKSIVEYPSWFVSNESKGISLSDEERIILHLISSERQAEMAWVAHLIFNRGKLEPDILKYSFSVHKIYGQKSESLLRLIELICSLNKDIFLSFKNEVVPDEDLPAWIWTLCEIGFSLQRLRDTKLGSRLCIPYLLNPNPLLSKDKSFKLYKHYLDWLEGVNPDIPEGLKTAKHPLSYLYSLVMEESKQLAKVNDEFDATVWKNYLQIERACNNATRKSKNRQNLVLKPDGTLFVSGKNHKIPVECKRM